jgi:hypothetical protein
MIKIHKVLYTSPDPGESIFTLYSDYHNSYTNKIIKFDLVLGLKLLIVQDFLHFRTTFLLITRLKKHRTENIIMT